MKSRQFLSTLFIIILFVWNGSVSALAINTGFSTGEMDSKDQQVFLSNIDLSLVNKEPKKTAITCFDVNDNGLIAIGSNDSAKKLVSVYTSNGDFKYGYVFYCSGSFGLEWDNNNLTIYFVRSDVAASFDASGVNVGLKKIEDTIDNNSYWNHSVFSTQRVVGENQYVMRNNMGFLNIFASSYSQLVKIDTAGIVTTIYDVSSAHTAKTIIIFIAVILFIAVVVSIIIWKIVKAKNHT